MKRIILSIFSVFITLGAAAETEQARPAMQQSETAADAETPSVTAESAAAPAAQTATPATAQTSENLQIAETFATPVPSPIAAEKQKRPKEQRFLPTRKRIDREINKLKFAYKGEVMMGLTASYGTLSSDDTDIMLILDNINADGTVATVKPFVSYFYRDNNCIGVRFGYRHMSGTLDNTYFDAGEGNDLSPISTFRATTTRSASSTVRTPDSIPRGVSDSSPNSNWPSLRVLRTSCTTPTARRAATPIVPTVTIRR